MSHEAHATFGSINVRKCQIRKEGLHKSVALVPLTLDSFSSESLVWLPFLMSSLLMSTEFFARQKDFSCSFIVDRLGNRFPQNWQAKNYNKFFDENCKFLSIYFIINQSQNWSKRLTERFFSRVNSLVGHDVSSLDECFVAESEDPLDTVSKSKIDDSEWSMGKYEPTSEGFVAAVDPLVAQEVSSEAEGSSAKGTSEWTLLENL